MRVERVELRDFMAFRQASFSLPERGITLVEGVVQTPGALGSNGAGKSAMLDAIAYALFGRVMRDGVSGDDVIRRGAGGCRVRVELVDGDKRYVVERYRNDPERGTGVVADVNGREIARGTASMTGDAVARALRCTYRDFVSTIAFGATDEAASFCTATDAERKGLLERLLGLARFDAAGEAREQLRAAKVAQDAASKALEASRQRLDVLVRESPTTGDVARLRVRCVNARLFERAARAVVSRVGSRLRAAEAQLDDARYEAALEEWRAAKQRYEAERIALQANHRLAVRESAQAEAEHDAAVKALAALQLARCPTCKRAMPVNADKVAEAEKRVRDAAFRADAAKLEEAQRAAAIKAHEQTDPPEKPVRHDAVLRAAVASQREALDGAKRQHADARRARDAALRELAALWDAVKQADDEADRARVQVDESARALVDATVRVEDLEFWSEGFGPRGVRSYLLEAVLPELGRKASEYAARLIVPGASIYLSATATLKSSDRTVERLTVHCDIPGMARKYDEASRGQRRRIDLCILFAIRDLLRRRFPGRGFNQLFIDEIFDGLSAAGRDAVLSLLREIARDTSVVLVTHDTRLKAVADQCIVVLHDGTGATIRET